MSGPARRVLVIGGGITGLTVAHEILARGQSQQRSPEVLLLEAGQRLGGVIRTERRDGCVLEAGPDSFVMDKPWALDLSRRLGLGDELIGTRASHRRSFVVHRGRLLPVPDGFFLLGPSRLWPLALSPLFSVAGKARAIAELAVPRPAGAGDESVAGFVTRRFGREVFERLAEPMIRSIASDDPAKLSMRALLPHFLEMERRHGSIIKALKARSASANGASNGTSGARYGLFVSFRQGMQTLVDRLVERLPPSSIRLGKQVSRIRRSADPAGWQVHLADGEVMAADAVCLALPAFRAASLVQELDAPLAEGLSKIPYASWITLNVAYRRSDVDHPMTGFGFVAPAVERLPLTGCTFTHMKFPGRAPEDRALLRAFVRCDGDPKAGPGSDDEVYRRVEPSLRRLLGVRGRALFVQVNRFAQALPQYHVGHLDRVDAIEQRLRLHPGLFVAGNAYRGHGVTPCVGNAQDVVAALCEAS